MSKENIFGFLNRSTQDDQLKAKLDVASGHDDVAELANEVGNESSPEQVDEAPVDLNQKPDFFRMLAKAAIEIFRSLRYPIY